MTEAVGRRAFLAAIGVAGLAGCSTPVPVHHQPGVVTPASPVTELVAYDVTARDGDELGTVLRALSSPVAGASLTIAAGAALFDARFGIPRPQRLTQMPSFRSDVLDPAVCHGDLLVQIGADTQDRIDATLARQIPFVTERWRIAGTHQTRNLFGFREGAGNPDPADAALMDQHIWVGPGSSEPGWCVGGTYQVVRLIRLAMAPWDREPAHLQERVFGRRKDSGAPLGQPGELSPPDYAADPSGQVIALDAHIRRANPRTPDAQEHRILRRGHVYRRSEDDAGQIFVCFQRDVELGFATIQRRLAGESLEKYLLPFGGGYYFVLPGTNGSADDYVGRSMLAAT
jgi:deferrochelatase/peroxidase EfeB